MTLESSPPGTPGRSTPIHPLWTGASEGVTVSRDHAVQQPGKEPIWVGVRIRPLFLSSTLDSMPAATATKRSAWKAVGIDNLVCSAEEKAGQTSSYYYNRVFSESASSEEVYEASAKQLVASAMAGYNCTLFAYGQTGSGKTHTMRCIMKVSWWRSLLLRWVPEAPSRTPYNTFV